MFRLNLALIAVVIAGLSIYPSRNSTSLIVIANPFGARSDAAAIVAQADGTLIKGGRAGAILARNVDPDFIVRLYAAGALLVLDGGLLKGCGA